MRILHVISSPASGGAEVYVKDIVIQLKKLDHNVSVGFLNHAVDDGRSQQYEDSFLSELDDASIPYFFIGNESRKKPWLGVVRVQKYIKENNIDIYHSHLPYGVFFGALLRIPIVYTHHSIKPRMSSLQYFIFNRIVDSYVGISDKCTEKLEVYTGKTVTTILNGVSLSKIKKKDLPSNESSKVQAIAVGRIHPHKNYFLMIDAISLLAEEVKSKFNLNIAGEGGLIENKKLQDYIKYKKVDNIVNLLGNRNDIPELLVRSDIFLMSSTQEGLPIALIEASATGLACLVTNVGGCSEIIEQCENGFVVELNNVGDYVDKLNLLILNESLRKSFSHNALVKSKFLSVENSAKKHMLLYTKLLSKG